MKLLVWNDGRVVEATDYTPPGAYVYQRIHTLGYKPYNLSRHIMLLREASAAMFGFMSLCRVEDAENIISKLLELSRVSRHLSCAVTMRLDPKGVLSFEVEAPSLYAGSSLRAKRPKGTLLQVPGLTDYHQTAVTLANDTMNDCRVEGFGDVAICVDDKGEVISLPWRPLFAVYHNKIYTPCEYGSVEYVVAAEAISTAGFELATHPLPVDSLRRMDEIFLVDVMGITSLHSIEHHHLLYMVTSQVADRMKPKIGD